MPDAASWSRARILAALLVAPVLLFGPILASGQVFLPFLPVCDEPLAGERAELDSAWRIVNRRLVGAAQRRPTFRGLPDSGTSIPALPTT